jgi:LPXTG-motif cell wall-anchored protein
VGLSEPASERRPPVSLRPALALASTAALAAALVVAPIATVSASADGGWSSPTLVLSESSGTALIQILWDEPVPAGGATFDVTVTPQTADFIDDFSVFGGDLSAEISASEGTTAQFIPVVFVNDSIDEPDETFLLTISNMVGETIGQASTEITIQDNDPTPEARVTSTAGLEGNAGISTMTFPVAITTPSSQTVSFDWTTADGTATIADHDYVSAFGSISFPPGETETTVSVQVNGDLTPELDETFAIELSNPVNGDVGFLSNGTGTIRDDDTSIVSFVDDVTDSEGGAGAPPTPFTFEVELSRAASVPVTVDYTTVGGTAVSDDDFLARSGTLTFAAGITSQTVIVPVIGDGVYENDETFTVELSAPAGPALLGDDTAVGTILNDDVVPLIELEQTASVVEGDGPAIVSVEVSGETEVPITFTLETFDDTALAGSDYAARTVSASILESTDFEIAIVDDAVVEPEEAFGVEVFDLENGAFGDGRPSFAPITISDDDAPAAPGDGDSDGDGDGDGDGRLPDTGVTIAASGLAALALLAAGALALILGRRRARRSL